VGGEIGPLKLVGSWIGYQVLKKHINKYINKDNSNKPGVQIVNLS